jgi:hypothetical protein
VGEILPSSFSKKEAVGTADSPPKRQKQGSGENSRAKISPDEILFITLPLLKTKQGNEDKIYYIFYNHINST